jgi:hypothetical protein
MEDKKKITPEERVEGILKRFSPIDHEYEKRLDRAVSKYFAGRRSNDSAFDDVFEFYYNKGDLSSADITIEEYDELDWNPSVRIRAEVVQSADLDDELFYYLRGIVDPDWYDDDDDEDDDDDDY